MRGAQSVLLGFDDGNRHIVGVIEVKHVVDELGLAAPDFVSRQQDLAVRDAGLHTDFVAPLRLEGGCHVESLGVFFRQFFVVKGGVHGGG